MTFFQTVARYTDLFCLGKHCLELRPLLSWLRPEFVCVSCPSANESSAIFFYFLPDQAQTHLDHVNFLDKLWCQISFKSDNG